MSADLVAEIVGLGQPGELVIAGSDTSSAIIRRLRPSAIAFEGDIGRGVPLCTAEFDGRLPLPIVLKGGQIGGGDLFDDIATRVFAHDRRRPSPT